MAAIRSWSSMREKGKFFKASAKRKRPLSQHGDEILIDPKDSGDTKPVHRFCENSKEDAFTSTIKGNEKEELHAETTPNLSGECGESDKDSQAYERWEFMDRCGMSEDENEANGHCAISPEQQLGIGVANEGEVKDRKHGEMSSCVEDGMEGIPDELVDTKIAKDEEHALLYGDNNTAKDCKRQKESADLKHNVEERQFKGRQSAKSHTEKCGSPLSQRISWIEFLGETCNKDEKQDYVSPDSVHDVKEGTPERVLNVEVENVEGKGDDGVIDGSSHTSASFTGLPENVHPHTEQQVASSSDPVNGIMERQITERLDDPTEVIVVNDDSISNLLQVEDSPQRNSLICDTKDTLSKECATFLKENDDGDEVQETNVNIQCVQASEELETGNNDSDCSADSKGDTCEVEASEGSLAKDSNDNVIEQIDQDILPTTVKPCEEVLPSTVQPREGAESNKIDEQDGTSSESMSKMEEMQPLPNVTEDSKRDEMHAAENDSSACADSLASATQPRESKTEDEAFLKECMSPSLKNGVQLHGCSFEGTSESKFSDHGAKTMIQPGVKSPELAEPGNRSNTGPSMNTFMTDESRFSDSLHSVAETDENQELLTSYDSSATPLSGKMKGQEPGKGRKKKSSTRKKAQRGNSFKERLQNWFQREKVPLRKTLSDGKERAEKMLERTSAGKQGVDGSLSIKQEASDGYDKSKTEEEKRDCDSENNVEPLVSKSVTPLEKRPGQWNNTTVKKIVAGCDGGSSAEVHHSSSSTAGEIQNGLKEEDPSSFIAPLDTLDENEQRGDYGSVNSLGASSSRFSFDSSNDHKLYGGSVRLKRRTGFRSSSKRRRYRSCRVNLSSCPDLTNLQLGSLYAKPRTFSSVREGGVYRQACLDRCPSCKQSKLACLCWIPEPDIYEDHVFRGLGIEGPGSDRDDSGISQDNELDFGIRGRNKSLSNLLNYKRNTTIPNQQEQVLLEAVEKFEDIKKELKATALTIQDAISKLQLEYKRTSQISQSTDDGNHGDNMIPPSEHKLVRLCSRNRRCLSKLLSAEWKDGKVSSGSSSIAHSEHSTDGSTDQNDTDFSDSVGDGVTPNHEAEDGVLGSTESLRDADITEEDEEVRPESVVTDLETCKDFVQGLANQVQAMQEALRKSKDDLDTCGLDSRSNGQTENMNSQEECSTLSLQDVSEEALDDGAYETPIKSPAVVLVSSDRHSQSDYEEVSDISEQNEQRSPLTNGYHSDNYINISTYERTESLQSVTNKETTDPKTKENSRDAGAIYEFPPDNEEKKKKVVDNKSLPGEITDEEPKAQFKYDGPLIFDDDDKKDIFKVREKDKVKKWDPVPILRELYESPPSQNGWANGSESSTPTVKAGECSMEGYMEKLPMGRRRASLIKKWKRRYFRCKGGNLFYYEDHKTKKSLGYLHLIGGKVTEISNKVLEVTDMRGRVLLLRCASKMEFEDWKAILNAETGFYLCQRSSFINTITKSVVIIDLGSCSVRAGILSDCETTYPQRFFPSAAAINNKSKDCIAYGFDAFTPPNRASSKLVFPLRRPPRLEQFKLNIQLIEGLLDTAFTELKIDPRAYNVLLVVPFNLGTKATEKIVEMVFEQFHVEGIFIREQTLMSLYSYKATTGIVVNIGEKLDVVPIVDGFIVEKGVCRLPFGGRQITETLTRLLTESGHRFFSEVETVISRYLKEKACFVAQDFQAELKFCSLDPELCSTFLSLDKYNIPDGTRTIKLDYSRFRSAEGIFHPECWGKDHSGLHTVVYKAIQACNVELRRHMCKNIYLCGGTTLLPGLAERLRSELIKLLPKGNSVRVHASAERYHAAYHGACTLAPLSAFDNLCVTKDEWKQLGTTSLTKWQNV